MFRKMKKLLGLLTCLVMMVGLMTVNLNAKGGNHQHEGFRDSTHVDVRVEGGELTFITKQNGAEISKKTIEVTVTAVSGTINGNALAFAKKNGEGIENEWRASIGRELAPASDVVTLEFTVKGKAPNDALKMTVTKTYSGESVMKGWIKNCPGSKGNENATNGNVGYDIDFESTDLQELFTVDLTVNKVWREDTESIRPDTIDVQLYADGIPYDEKVTLSAAGQWTYTFTGLPVFAENGSKISYTVKEVNVPDGYTSSVEAMKITNTYTNTKNISITKVWDDEDDADELRPESVTVKLIADNNATDYTVELNAENQWTASFTDLAVYKDGKAIVYDVEEVNVPTGYRAKITGDAKDGFTIKNIHTVEEKPEEPEIEEPEEPEIEEPEVPEEPERPETPTTPETENKNVPDTAITGTPAKQYENTAVIGLGIVIAGMFMLVMAGKKEHV